MKFKLLILCTFFVFQLNAQYTENCLLCLIELSTTDIKVQSMIDFYGLKKEVKEDNGSKYEQFSARGIEIAAYQGMEEGSYSISYINIYPQYFDHVLPYGLTKNLSKAEAKKAIETALGGLSNYPNVKSITEGQNSLKVIHFEQLAQVRYIFNPSEKRIVNVQIELPRAGIIIPSEFDYKGCFAKAKSNPPKKIETDQDIVQATGFAEILDDTWNDFKNLKGEFKLEQDDTKVYDLELSTSGYEHFYLDERYDKTDRYGNPDVRVRKVFDMEMTKSDAEAEALKIKELMDKFFKEEYPNVKIDIEEKSNTGKTYIYSARFFYNGEPYYSGHYFQVKIIYGEHQTDNYFVALHIEGKEF